MLKGGPWALTPGDVFSHGKDFFRFLEYSFMQ